jgi:negative regulator of flagellin synthesis FlgM
MTININNLNNQTQVHQNKQTQVKQDAAQVANNNAQVKHVARDSVSLTPQAQQFKELQKKSADAPAVDQKKIDELKKAISSGEYKVDAEKLMKNMLSYEFDLLEN